MIQKRVRTAAAKAAALLMLITALVPMGAHAVSARGYALMEASTGRLLYAENEDEQLPMASTTKILTCIIAIENCDLDDEVKVDERAVGLEGTSMYLRKGEKVAVRELLYGLMIASGNDAAAALAYHISGSIEEFAELMNGKAEAIGARNSNFTNPNGLPDENHYTTAEDLCRIAAYCMQNEIFREIVATESMDLPQDDDSPARYLRSKNRLLREFEGGNGVKTGFTKAAGKCLVAGAERDGMQLVAVLLNDYSMWDDSKSLLQKGFEEYSMQNVLEKGESMGEVSVKNGIEKSVKAEVAADVCLPLKAEEYKMITYEIILPKNIEAPVSDGQNVGKVEVLLNGEKLAEAPLCTACDVEENSYEYNLKKVIRSFIAAFDWRKSAYSKIHGRGRYSVSP